MPIPQQSLQTAVKRLIQVNDLDDPTTIFLETEDLEGQLVAMGYKQKRFYRRGGAFRYESKRFPPITLLERKPGSYLLGLARVKKANRLRNLLAEEGLIKKAANKNLDQHLSEWLLDIYEEIQGETKVSDWPAPVGLEIHSRTLMFTLNVYDVTGDPSRSPAQKTMRDIGVRVTLVLETLTVLRADFQVFGGGASKKSRLDLPADRPVGDLADKILREAGDTYSQAF